MAVSAATVWEIRQDTGNDANGGGYVTGSTGSNLTYPTSSPVNLTTAVSPAAGNTVNHASAADSWVGNICNVVSGTGFTTTANASRFEILSVIVGVSFTCGTNISGASICVGGGGAADGVINIGGALKLDGAGAAADTILENVVAGNKYYVLGNLTYNLSFAISVSVLGTAIAPIMFIGYAVTRGDNPTGSTRPNWTMANVGFTVTAYWQMKYVILTGAANPAFIYNGGGALGLHCKFVCVATTSTFAACSTSAAPTLINCEFVNPRGVGLTYGLAGVLYGCWFHDCNDALNYSAATCGAVINCIFSGNKNTAINFTASTTASGAVIGNTIYGYSSSTPIGTGINFAAGSVQGRIENNIFFGLATGINHPTANQTTIVEDYNTFPSGVTTPRTNIPVGVHSVNTLPTFTNVVQRSGSTATITAGNHLVQTGATFQTWGITAGTHYLYYASGSGAATVGIYRILSVDSETQLTTTETFTANATGDHVWYITTGFNWSIDSALKGLGGPVFQGSAAATVTYQDIGAVQRKEDYPVVGDVKTGIVYSNSELTGTQANITGGGGGFVPRR